MDRRTSLPTWNIAGYRSIVRRPPILAAVALALAAAGCDRDRRRIVLATTTSVRDCGLLDALIGAFERETGVRVAPVAAGSGEAMRMGRDGNADVLLVHDPDGEAEMIAQGVATERIEVMLGRFVVVGPPSDPAGVRGVEDAPAVFARLASGAAPFVSRGDGSGTHRAERRMWREAGVEPGGAWYVSTGTGMVETLRVASERRAYCLADEATFLRARSRLDIEMLAGSRGVGWANPYSVLLLSPGRHPGLRHEEARLFARFLSSGPGRAIVESFGRTEFGRALFEVP